MGDILELFDHLWGISDNTAIYMSVVIVVLVVLVYMKFKICRHSRYRMRILFVAVLILLNINIYFFGIVTFEVDNIYFYVLEALLVAYAIASAYKPILTFFFLKRVKTLSRGGFREKSDRYFRILKYTTVTTASKLKYKILLADDYANRHLYAKAYKELYHIEPKKLFETEKNDLETYLSYYAALLGSIRLAKAHINQITCKSPMSLLVEMTICDVCNGTSEQIMEYLDKAESMLTLHTPDAVKAQIYANYGNCRMMQGNFEDALFNVKKALTFAKRAKNKTIIYNIYEQLIFLICNNSPNAKEISVYFKEYLKSLNMNEPSTAIRAYNFMSRYYRLQNQENMLLPLVASNYSALIRKLKGCERYNWEVSNLDVALHAGIHIKNIMYDVKRDFSYYYNVQMPDRFFLMKKLYGILDCFFANVSENAQYSEYRIIFEKCESYITEKAYDDLKKYYDGLDTNEIYERCSILGSMVAVSAMSEWHNRICIIRYDKLLGNAYSYESMKIISDKSEHYKRINILEDIADIYDINGLIPRSIEAYINIVEECYSVYWLGEKSAFDINVIDRENMEKYIGIAIEKIEKSNNFRRFQAQLIHIAAQLCVLGKYIEANRYLQIFDKRELKNFNNKVVNCYKFTEDMLKLHGYT